MNYPSNLISFTCLTVANHYTIQFINNSVGWVLHSALLVPYHSWRISHSRHHKATGHMSRDQVIIMNKGRKE
jgi:fatty acid desaturase